MMPEHSRDHESTRLHAHRAGDATHTHAVEGRDDRVLAGAIVLTLLFALIEAGAGLWSHSLALISDAGHMLTDASALGLALLAQYIARRPPSPKHSFGLGRAEALAAFLNALAMLGVVALISYESIQRFTAPEAVKGEAVLIVAAIGLAVNIAVAMLLSRDRESVNTRAALVHVIGDLLGSVAALVSGAVIYWTGWMTIDPILSIVVCLLILNSTVRVLRDAHHFLMEGVPHHINYLQVGADLEAIEGVISVHDLHVWEMTPGHPALIGHVEIGKLENWPMILQSIRRMLLERHGVDHITLQPETARVL